MYGVGVSVCIHIYTHTNTMPTLYIHTIYYIHDKYITKDLLYISKYIVEIGRAHV